MIFGVFNRSGRGSLEPGRIEEAVASGRTGTADIHTLAEEGCGFSSMVPFESPDYRGQGPVSAENGLVSVVFSGLIYNKDELSELCPEGRYQQEPGNVSFLILDLYRKFGLDFAKNIDGKFAVGIMDRDNCRLVLARDHLGIEPLYYYMDENRVVFSSSIQPIFRFTGMSKELNHKALGKFLLFNYNPGMETFFTGVFKLRPAHCLVVEEGRDRLHRYWRLSFAGVSKMGEDELAEELFRRIGDAVAVRVDKGDSPGIFLSGGMDSSTVASFVRGLKGSRLKTFSYRCRSESFDESRYAKIMAEYAGSDHVEIEYSSKDVLGMHEIAGRMNEPFCDVGINIATAILGREAGGSVPYVLTGDGGDELFAGHPVYEADKVARYFDIAPYFIKRPLIGLFSLLPDSDKKKNLTVKLKRFSENFRLPKELLTHRWRTYYRSDQLEGLLAPSIFRQIDFIGLCEDLLQFNSEADGPDLLSRSLYSDYQSIVDFYLRRNDLNMRYDLETRYPMLDYRLVDFCASIPSSMKVRGWFDTKYILRKAMERALPDDIVHRKDKLGHSIPLKNWIRDDREIREYIGNFTSEETIRRRGIFRFPAVRRLFSEHDSKQRNNSHRIWALAVFEMWMRENFDR